jgi:hypothetical protein
MHQAVNLGDPGPTPGGGANETKIRLHDSSLRIKMNQPLDPGILPIVNYLNQNGFETCDSGDGRTKPLEHQSFPGLAHVIIKSSPETLIQDAKRFSEFVKMMRSMGGLPYPDWTIEASYSPLDDQAIILFIEIRKEELSWLDPDGENLAPTLKDV